MHIITIDDDGINEDYEGTEYIIIIIIIMIIIITIIIMLSIMII